MQNNLHNIKGIDFINTIKNKPIFDVWIPEFQTIVLGKSSVEGNDIKDQVYEEKINIVRRDGGGGTVFLDNGTLIVDIAFKLDKSKSINSCLDMCESIILKSLNKMNFEVEVIKGNHDFVWANKKIAGISVYKRKNVLLYGISILLKTTTVHKISKYLKIPLIQPGYRNNRSHNEFLISLEQIKSYDIKKLKNSLIKELENSLC